MTLASGALVFAVIWWMVLFAVLPWGVQPPDRVEPGHATSAPARPRIFKKFAITTAIAGVLWGAAYWLIQSDLISFRGI